MLRNILASLMAVCVLSQVSSVLGADLVLGFRMKKQKHLHMHDAAATTKFVDTLKMLQVDVKTAQHGNHQDVIYSAPQWKSLALKKPSQLKEWKKWLADNGFETLVSYPAGKAEVSKSKEKDPSEIVQFRAAKQVAMHIHNETSAKEAVAIFKALGCQVERSTHNDHFDVKIQCPQWREIAMPDHKSASAWEKYLKDAGLETKHEHRH